MTRVRVERQPEKHGRSVNYTAIGLRGGWDARYILREPTARNRIIDFQGRGGELRKRGARLFRNQIRPCFEYRLWLYASERLRRK